MFGTMIENFQDTIDLAGAGKLDDPNRRRFYFWSDHDTGMMTLACNFGYQLPHYPTFAQQMLWELWETPEHQFYVNMTINSFPIPLLQACEGAHQCEFTKFVEVLKENSYLEQPEQWDKVCNTVPGGKKGLEELLRGLEERKKEDDSYDYDNLRKILEVRIKEEEKKEK